MFQKLNQRVAALALVPVVALASSSAMAQGTGLGIADAVTSQLSSAGTDVKAIGLAAIGVIVIIVAFTLARRAIK
jgi:hypothetical protein